MVYGPHIEPAVLSVWLAGLPVMAMEQAVAADWCVSTENVQVQVVSALSHTRSMDSMVQESLLEIVGAASAAAESRAVITVVVKCILIICAIVLV
jgi:hypothetical protein